jgi:hypothetical protein
MKKIRVPKWLPSSKKPTRILVVKTWLARGLQNRVTVEIDEPAKIRELVKALRPAKAVGDVYYDSATPLYLVDIFLKEKKMVSVGVAGKYVLFKVEWYSANNERVGDMLEELCRGKRVHSHNLAKELVQVLSMAR